MNNQAEVLPEAGRRFDDVPVRRETAALAHLLLLDICRKEFAQLSPTEQGLLTLVDVEGADYDTAAATLGLERPLVSSGVFAGRHRLATAITMAIAEHAVGVVERDHRRTKLVGFGPLRAVPTS